MCSWTKARIASSFAPKPATRRCTLFFVPRFSAIASTFSFDSISRPLSVSNAYFRRFHSRTSARVYTFRSPRKSFTAVSSRSASRVMAL